MQRQLILVSCPGMMLVLHPRLRHLPGPAAKGHRRLRERRPVLHRRQWVKQRASFVLNEGWEKMVWANNVSFSGCGRETSEMRVHLLEVLLFVLALAASISSSVESPSPPLSSSSSSSSNSWALVKRARFRWEAGAEDEAAIRLVVGAFIDDGDEDMEVLPLDAGLWPLLGPFGWPDDIKAAINLDFERLWRARGPGDIECARKVEGREVPPLMSCCCEDNE